MQTEKKAKKRSQAEKLGRRKWIIRELKLHRQILKQLDRRTRMLMAGLKELLMLDEDFITKIACKDDLDRAIFNAIKQASTSGRFSNEIAIMLNMDHRRVSERIHRMNKRMRRETGDFLIQKGSQKEPWKINAQFRRDLNIGDASLEVS